MPSRHIVSHRLTHHYLCDIFMCRLTRVYGHGLVHRTKKSAQTGYKTSGADGGYGGRGTCAVANDFAQTSLPRIEID